MLRSRGPVIVVTASISRKSDDTSGFRDCFLGPQTFLAEERPTESVEKEEGWLLA
jgi:hypothetical protein